MIQIPIWAVGVLVTLGLATITGLVTVVARFTRTNTLLEEVRAELHALAARFGALEDRLSRLDRSVAVLEDRGQRGGGTNPHMKLVGDDGPIGPLNAGGE